MKLTKTTLSMSKEKHNSSSGLSHLFEQGDVSLTFLNIKDKKFMNGLKNKTKLSDNDLTEKKPHIHFLIIDKAQKPRLPLFSEIALYKTIKSIRAKNGNVSWSIVREI